MHAPPPSLAYDHRGPDPTRDLMAFAKAAALGRPVPAPTGEGQAGEMIALARLHRCLAIVAGPLQMRPGLDQPRRAELERAEAGAWATYAVTAAAMGPVLAQAATVGLTVIAYKGAAHATRYYHVPSARPMSDVDLLVLPAEKERLYQIFHEQNFQTFAMPGREWTKAISHERIFVPTTAGARSADVHTAPASPARHHLPVEELLARSRPGILFGAPVRFLSPEDELVVMAVNHGADHFRGGFVRSLDAWLMDGAEAIDWSAVVSRAHQAGAAAVSWLMLSHARTIAGLAVPDDVLTALRPSALRRMWLAALLDAAGFGDPRVALPRRLEQLLLAYPTLDQPTGFARFAAFHGGLRVLDAAQSFVDQVASGLRSPRRSAARR